MSRALPLLALTALFLGASASAQAQLWSRPVACTDCITDFYYVDEGGQDWSCGNSTYADHTGSDYSLRNGNFAIDDDNEVIAMAPGVVVSTQDGYYDRCTQCGGFNCGTNYGNGFANQVIINHGTYRTIYGHMKSGSIAVKMGDMVSCGQVLGFIGSSGCSTGAHLHIEPSIAADFQVKPYVYIDPYAGACSPTATSLWSDQGVPRVLPGAACDGQPAVPSCPAETYPIWTCTADGKARRRCVDGVVAEEACVAGCNVMPAGTDDVCQLPPDADGDGSRSDVDCDEANSAIHPGAVELCGDAIDQDCSGADLPCMVPPTTAGSGGASGAGGQAGAAGGAGAAGLGVAPGAPSLVDPGTSGSAALPFGQAGQLGSQAGSFGPPPILPVPPVKRAAAATGCSLVSPGSRAGSSALPGLGALLLLVRRRRR